MPTITINRLKSSSLSPDFERVRGVDIPSQPFAGGGFGHIYSCAAIDGKAPRQSQIIKILVNVGNGIVERCFSTIQKLQEKIIKRNNELRRQHSQGIETIPALFALPQFSFEGSFQGKNVFGYATNIIDTSEYKEFEQIIDPDQGLWEQYSKLPLSQKLRSALDLVIGMRILRDMSYIHADINAKNLFVSMKTGHLIIIDYDSGAVTDNPNDMPTTFGKRNEWVAPEISKQIAQSQSRVPTVKVDLFTDTWSVAVGLHYLICCVRHPFFFLKSMGVKDMQDYFALHKWPNIDKTAKNFARNQAKTYEKVSKDFDNDPTLACLKKPFSVTFNEGFYDPGRRTTYAQWITVLSPFVQSLPSSPSSRLPIPGGSSIQSVPVAPPVKPASVPNTPSNTPPTLVRSVPPRPDNVGALLALACLILITVVCVLNFKSTTIEKRKDIQPGEHPRKVQPPQVTKPTTAVSNEPRQLENTAEKKNAVLPRDQQVIALLCEKSRSYHDLCVRNKIGDMLELYEFPIRFYDKGYTHKAVVRDEWAKYFEKWSHRKSRIEHVAYKEGSVARGTVTIRIIYRYHWTGKATGSIFCGQANAEVTWERIGGNWKIVALDERTERWNNCDNWPEPRRSTHYDADQEEVQQFDTPTGWVIYVTNDPDPPTNIRGGPGTGFPIIAEITSGTTVFVWKPDNNQHWWWVQTREGYSGYIYRRLLQRIGD